MYRTRLVQSRRGQPKSGLSDCSARFEIYIAFQIKGNLND